MFFKIKNKFFFDDNSSIRWLTKESFEYKEGDFVVEIWADYYKAGLFKYGRAFEVSALKEWDSFLEGEEYINEDKLRDIKRKIKIYCTSKNITFKFC